MTEGHTERLEAALDGKYRIERKLGEGGMASVYLAEDIKHHRKVALKILKPELAAVIGAERFLSEIRTTANLQHPHILALFDSGEAAGYLYYVMPYIEGETLREKLEREKQLGVDESIRIARDVADALDYAHRQGVIHRDIKPANILLHDGRPVVADFGIALAVAQAGGGRMTATGLSLGTPHYMSPEQASADRDLSARSDVYSLGCVLYEMIGGQPPHTGPSAQSILVHILTEEATPLTKLRHTVPPHVAATVSKAIEKLPADRFETAKAFMDALGDEGFAYQTRPRDSVVARESGGAGATAVPARLWHRDPRSLIAAMAVALAAWGWLRPTPPPAPGITTRSEATGLDINAPGWRLAISPDGRWIVTGHREGGSTSPSLYIRSAEDTEWRRLPNTEGGTNPTFSPDGQSVAFNAGGALLKVPITGGPALPIAGGVEPHWGLPDVIVYDDPNRAIYRVAASGGEPELLFESDSIRASRPFLLPNGRGVVFGTDTGGDPLNSRIMSLDTETGEVRQLVASGNQPRYLPSGHLIYGHGDQALMGVPFDIETLEITGAPVVLLTELDVYAGGASQFAVSESGTLIYAVGSRGGVGGELSLVWVDRSGREEPIPATPRSYLYPRISPDGRRVAISVGGGNAGIWIWNFAGETASLLATGEGSANYPVWTPDGERIAYGQGNDVFWIASNNTGDPEVLAESPGGSDGAGGPSPYFFSPDGTALVYRDQANPETDDDLSMIRIGTDEPGDWGLAGRSAERNAVLSPDGRWMAYQSDESGVFEIYVRPFPAIEDDLVPISNNGGMYPLWSPDGRELFYLQPGATFQMIAVSLDVGGADGAFRFGDRTVVMDWPYTMANEGRNHDIAPDGERFLAIKEGDGDGGGETPRVYLVTSWLTELRERMGEN